MTTDRKARLRPLQFSYSQKFFNYQIHTADRPAGRNDWIAITKCETLSNAEHKAYAACLAAAPDLLAELERLYELYGHEKTRRAIARAQPKP